MKGRLISLLALLCLGLAAVAVPARPGWQTFTQSDGTTLQVQAVGNAFNHAILTTDGLTVARGSDGNFYYTSSLTGLTAVLAHNADNRTAAESAFIKAQQSNLKMAEASPFKMQRPQSRLKTVGGSNEESGVPAMGQRKIPIILVEFKDKKFNNTREEIIDAMLTGNESVGQYYRDQSNGLYQPEFDVFGIYSLSQNRQYYGGNINGNDKGLGYMVTEACQMAAAAGVSFKPYDTNSDNYCDVVIVIYAGVGESSASTTYPESIWPCNWSLEAAAYYGMGGNGAFRPNNGDPIVDNFAVFNELYGSNDNGKTIDGIGTFTHEFSHCLGLPDFYDTGNGNHYGLGYWDNMCMGCYNNDGFTPPGYSAYEKVFMGWIEYITPKPGTYYTLPVFNQKNAETDKALCITSDLNENEYFIIENRRKQGWDRYEPGEGIMITHVTYDANRWGANTLNNQNIQLLTLMNADNSWSYYDEYGDLWPYNGKNAFTDNSIPAAKLNMKANGSITGNAGYLGKPVTEMVINEDGTASFWYMKDAATDPVISVSATDINLGGVMMNNSATMSFKVMGAALTDDVTLTLNDPDGVFTIDPVEISASDAINNKMVNVTFAPQALTDYEATVTLSSNGAEDVIVHLRGFGIIEGYAPVMQPADGAHIDLTQFRADWTDATPDANVSSYTLEVSLKPAVMLLGTFNGSNYPGGYEYITPQAPWGGSEVVAGYNAVYINSTGVLTFTVPEGYSNELFTVKITTADTDYGYGTLAAATPQTPASGHLFSSGETYAWLVTASSGERISITTTDANYSPDMAMIQVYLGDATVASLRADEQGDDVYRLITGITDMFYTVRNLQSAGTFRYKVKALYVDGTESRWSNVEEVTLSAHGYALGDVDHDGRLSITDVTTLINGLLTDMSTICETCGDVSGDGKISITDVTDLIEILLSNG